MSSMDETGSLLTVKTPTRISRQRPIQLREFRALKTDLFGPSSLP